MQTLQILGMEIEVFIKEDGETFESKLLSEAVNVSTKITDILDQGNIDLLKNARTLIYYVINQKDNELVAFAKQEGIAWAEHALTLELKLEWVQAIRRTLWHFAGIIDEEKNITSDRSEFYSLEKSINDNIDKFLNNFFLNYAKYKETVFLEQREMVEHLSVPIIPVSGNVSVLPLIGTIDSYRIQIIEEKVLNDIAKSRIQTLVMDLSGIAMMERDVINHFEMILAGVKMMGCKTVLTGLRPDLVRKMVHSGIRFEEGADTKGTLQETLKQYL
ncbi:Anti-anti-sigma regulatory factor (antagonist of anti-sigma factor) [Bacillus sp. OV322]|uniref:STAS domain-containing protein n=1 Tax=Bacillus sp. OV322 TaxID=1882764 RepID=UPI0008EB954F|nr:STAS domain-containing protein [Bacillus sp. OV322]SFC78796.1 Anti-anti-sigma regulatory factor (antagonist of anti-sigma factor) [Bacillus sp. OV322]